MNNLIPDTLMEFQIAIIFILLILNSIGNILHKLEVAKRFKRLEKHLGIEEKKEKKK